MTARDDEKAHQRCVAPLSPRRDAKSLTPWEVAVATTVAKPKDKMMRKPGAVK